MKKIGWSYMEKLPDNYKKLRDFFKKLGEFFKITLSTCFIVGGR